MGLVPLFPHQTEALKMLLSQQHGGALLALAPRLGKAVVSIRAAVEARKQAILVICPLSLLHNWRGKILEWDNSARPEGISLYRGKQPRPLTRWAVTNYDTVRTKGIASGFDLLILDESVLLKNRNARRTKTCRDAVLALRRNDPDLAVWELSGSPTTRHLDDLWAQLNIIDRKRFPSYWRFAREYTQLQTSVWGTGVIGDQSDAKDRIKRDLSDIFFSVNQQDIGSEVPFFFEDISVAMSDRQAAIYISMKKDFMAQLSELEDDTILAPNVLIQLLRLIQIASNPALVGGPNLSPKADAILEMLEYRDLPFVVWTNFIRTAGMLRERLAKHARVSSLTGATPSEERQRICDDFQSGRLDVLIAHPAVGKFGLELFAAKSAIFAERDWNSDNYYQALHRIRLATSPTSHITHMLSVLPDGSRTIDHTINAVLRRRHESSQKLTAREIRNELDPFWMQFANG